MEFVKCQLFKIFSVKSLVAVLDILSSLSYWLNIDEYFVICMINSGMLILKRASLDCLKMDTELMLQGGLHA